MYRKRISLSILCFCLAHVLLAQEAPMLTKQDAIAEVLQNNFGIEIANKNLEIASNNKNILNSGYLPTISANAGLSYDLQDQEATFQNGNMNTVDGAETNRYNASINLDYTLFDGLGRYWNYKVLKEQYGISELQVQQTMETTVLQLFSVYYEVARISENIDVLEDTYNNTKRRLERAKYAFEYGQNNKLDILNAEVDLVSDSINLMDARQLLINTKRDLNVLADTNLERNFKVDTAVVFTSKLLLDEYVRVADTANVRLLQAKKNKTINDYNYSSAKSVFLPNVALSGSYGWNEGVFPATNFLASNTSIGFSAGVSLRWNLFDGGTGITNVKNAKLLIANQETVISQIEKEVARDVVNAEGNYVNRLKIYALQSQNVVTAQNNFDRSNERYKLGQISSVELRQAQLNLLNVQTNKNFAKYQAKLAELELLQLTGQLLNVEF